MSAYENELSFRFRTQTLNLDIILSCVCCVTIRFTAVKRGNAN